MKRTRVCNFSEVTFVRFLLRRIRPSLFAIRINLIYLKSRLLLEQPQPFTLFLIRIYIYNQNRCRLIDICYYQCPLHFSLNVLTLIAFVSCETFVGVQCSYTFCCTYTMYVSIRYDNRLDVLNTNFQNQLVLCDLKYVKRV